MDALIGHSGFLGGVLRKQHSFSAGFNSKTMDKTAGQHFATLVCAAAPGSMFEANRAPDRDLHRILRLIAQLEQVRADRVVLISTIAVLAGFAAEDESSARFEETIPYGRHRRMLEEFASRHFAQCLVMRLPALFGPGLRKNFVFDILNPMPSMLTVEDREHLLATLDETLRHLVLSIYALDRGPGLYVIDRGALHASGQRGALEAATTAAGLSATRFTSPESRFQYYDLSRLWADIGIGIANGLDVLHLAPAPLQAATVHERLTGQTMRANQAPVHSEDMRTRHAALWGCEGAYIATPGQTLDALARFATDHGSAA